MTIAVVARASLPVNTRKMRVPHLNDLSGARMAHCVTLIGIRRSLPPAAVDFGKRIDGNSSLAGDPGYDPVKAGESATIGAISHAKEVR